MKIAVVAAMLFAVMVVVAGCGSSAAPKSNPPSSSSSNASSTTGSSGSTGSVSGICGDINAGKTLVQEMKNLGSNPSLASLTASLKKLQTKVESAKSSASANLKPGFAGVETADNAVQKSITQLKGSGIPVSSYIQTLKTGVGALATAYDSLVSFTKCA